MISVEGAPPVVFMRAKDYQTLPRHVRPKLTKSSFVRRSLPEPVCLRARTALRHSARSDSFQKHGFRLPPEEDTNGTKGDQR